MPDSNHKSIGFIGTGTGSLALMALMAGGGLLLVKKVGDYFAQLKKGQAEKELDTPEGQIALQLKNIFGETPVSDSKYRMVMQQAAMSKADMAKVRELYYLSTGGRRLSDDEQSHIGSGTQLTTTKQTTINKTPGSLIAIIDDRIVWNIGYGDLIRFPPGTKKSIALYANPQQVATGENPIQLKPSAALFRVSKFMEVPYSDLKLRDDWKKFFTPYIRTRKVFAAVQIEFLHPSGKKVLAWSDAREWRTVTPVLKGISGNSYQLL